MAKSGQRAHGASSLAVSTGEALLMAAFVSFFSLSPALAAGPAATAAAPAVSAPYTSVSSQTLKDSEAAKDDLSLRVIIKREARLVPSYERWREIRSLLHRRPGIGYSLLYKWESVPFKGQEPANALRVEKKANQWMDNADELLAQGQFQSAFTAYQSLAKILKREQVAGHNENELLFQMVQQSMGRALYGAGRYEDALTVYNSISRSHPRYREVLFEKMWTAFRSGHIDEALGSVASQQSTYFADFMEPEAYLVQLYIYKKLCRAEEEKAVRRIITKFRDQLQSGALNYSDWSRADLETYTLWKLTQQKVREHSGSVVSAAEQKREQERITDLLKERFAQERVRLTRELNRALAYSYLAVGTGRLKGAQVSQLENSTLRENGLEFWPVDDAEDWIDELGSNLYIGKSQCAQP